MMSADDRLAGARMSCRWRQTNHQRIHSAIGYITPEQAEAKSA